MKRVAVVGASGLVGATLVESLLRNERAEVRPLIHSSGNAWRLARRGIELKPVSLLDPKGLAEALRDCTHIVNCSRGGDDVMLQGLKNLLEVAKAMGAARFVHLSSVAVYGDPPPPESIREDAPARPRKGTYGAIKLAQDEMVRKAASAGLPAVVLCPPNISGPYSYFMLALHGALQDGTFRLLDDGDAPCNLVDVENLAHAAELAMDSDVLDGRRLFVTDDESVSWKQVAEGLLPLCRAGTKIRHIAREDLASAWRRVNAKPKASPMRSLTHLASGDVRKALRQDPLWAQVDSVARGLVTRLGSVVEDRLRQRIAGPIPVAKVGGETPLNVQLSATQLRGVQHSCERAKKDIGYRPRFGFRESLEAFSEWHINAQGRNGRFGDLIGYLA